MDEFISSSVFVQFHHCTFIYPGDITEPGIALINNILTCASTGGAATTVIWTKGSDESNLMPVFSDTVTQVSELSSATHAIYNHKLITAEIDAVYGCSVSNNKPSSAKAVATISESGKNCIEELTYSISGINRYNGDKFNPNLYHF